MKTIMLACISPSSDNYDETLSTLRLVDSLLLNISKYQKYWILFYLPFNIIFWSHLFPWPFHVHYCCVKIFRYANRAKNIKNKPKINEDPKDALLREYQEEIQRLKAMIQNGKCRLWLIECLRNYQIIVQINEICRIFDIFLLNQISGN